MNRSSEVDAYMRDLENPLKDVWEEIRHIVLGVDPRMQEDIKWSAPNFFYKGNLATFNPRAKRFVNLTFHTGALISDPDSVLQGDAKQVRIFRVSGSEELGEKRAGLEKVVRNWIQLRDR